MNQEPHGWDVARRELVRRWKQILERIDERDEGGVMALASVADEFCVEADVTMKSRRGRVALVPDLRHRITPARGTRPVGERCLFCRGLMELGGCYGILDELNRAVFDRQWDEARRIADDYLLRLERMPLPPAGDPAFHLLD